MLTLDADTTRKLYAVLDWASLWMSEYIEDVRTIPQDATAQANIRYYTPLHNAAEAIIDMMPWTDSGEGPFDSASDARDYVDSEFHATTRIRETPNGWIIQTLTTQETSCECDEPECETRDGGRTVVCTICGRDAS